MLVTELLTESQTLLEKLGNLGKLKAGPLLKALMGLYTIEDPKTNMYKSRTALSSQFGTESPVSDEFSVKNFAELKKKLTDDNSSAFTINLKGKAVLLMVPYDLNARSREQKVAYYKTAFETEEQTASRKADAEKSYNKHSREERLSDIVTDGAVSPSWVKEKLEALIKEHGKENVTIRTVKVDWGRQQKRRARQDNEPENFEKFKGIEALNKRLTLHKLAKQPTAEDLDNFFKMALGRTPKIRYEGVTYHMTNNDYESEKKSPQLRADIFQGKAFKIVYEPVPVSNGYSTQEPGFGQKITISMKFYPQELAMRPVSVIHSNSHSSTPKKSKIYNPEAHLLDKLHMADSKLTTAGLIRYFDKLKPDDALRKLEILKDSPADLPDWDDMIKKITNKVNRAVAKERIGKLHDGSVKTRLDD